MGKTLTAEGRLNKLFGFTGMFLLGSFIGFFVMLEQSGRYTLQETLYNTAIFVLVTAVACGLGILFLKKAQVI